MSTQSSPKPVATRRERRAAARKAAPVTKETSRSKARRSPLLWITLAIGGLAVVALGAAVLLQGNGASDTTALKQPTGEIPAALASGRELGKADAPVTLELWSDFQCPVCGEFAKVVEPQLITTYVVPGTLRIVHHDAAFQGAKASSSFDESVESAAAARCAADQNLYWQFQDWTFANQSGENKGAFADGRLRSIATAAGLDVTAWDACRKTGTEQAAVKAETQGAQTEGINSTPTLKINGQTLVGLRTAAELGQIIESAAASDNPG